MPKRSNEFQQLVKEIYSQLGSTGATVTESVLIGENASGANREIDILIEQEVAGVRIRIGVECRDHRRPADVKWIDELAGKYRDLSIDKVVAVSRNGFTRAAASKAASLRIELRSIDAAIATDWPAELDRIRLSLVSLASCFHLHYETEPPLPPEARIAGLEWNGSWMSGVDFQKWMSECLGEIITDTISASIGTQFRRPEEVDGTVEQGFDVSIGGCKVKDDEGRLYTVIRLTVHTSTDVSQSPVPVRRETFGDVKLVSGTLDLQAYGLAVDITAIHGGGEAKSKTVVSRVKPTKKP